MPRKPPAPANIEIDVGGILDALHGHANAKTTGLDVIPHVMALVDTIRAATDADGKLGAKISPEEWGQIGKAALDIGLDLTPFLVGVL